MKFQLSRKHQLVVNRKINYGFSHVYELYKLVELARDQRPDGVVEMFESFHEGTAGSKPIGGILFFSNLDKFKMPKKG